MVDEISQLKTRNGLKHTLRQVVKETYTVLQALKLRVHLDKTFIGKNEFDFLGFHCCPTSVKVSDAALSRRDKKLVRQQGASKKSIGVCSRACGRLRLQWER